MYKMSFGCSTSAKVNALSKREDYYNYYLAQCPNGLTNVHGYEQLVYMEVYPGIDLHCSSNELGLKYYFVVNTGADADLIKLKFAGASNTSVTPGEGLIIESSIGSLEFEKAHVYRINQGGNLTPMPASGAFMQTGTNEFGFNLQNYPPNSTLVIVMDVGHFLSTQNLSGSEWSSYFANRSDVGSSIVIDSKYKNGALYVSGKVYGSDFPTVAQFQLSNGGSWDAFISKFNSSNYDLEFSTYLGGNMEDECSSVDVNTQNILATGSCQGTNFPVYPTTNPNDGTYWQNNPVDDIMGIIVKLDLGGLRERITCFGGPGTTKITSGKLDDNSNLYITGYTNVYDAAQCTSGLPPANAFPIQPFGTAYYQSTHQYAGTTDLYDAFVAKFDNLNQILWSTLFGGNLDDWAMDICINNSDLYITGTTASPPDPDNCSAADNGFPICPSGSAYFQNYTAGGLDGFVAKFDIDGNILHSTYLGGLENDIFTDIAINSFSDCFVLGITESESDPDYFSSTPPTSHKLRIYDPNNTAKRQINNGLLTLAPDMVMFRFRQGNELQWSTYIGGQNAEVDYYIADYPRPYSDDLCIDTYNYVFIIGATNSADCGTKSSIGSINNSYNTMFDAYLIGYNNNNEMCYGTYIGGTGDDSPNCVTSTGNKLFFCGTTGSTDYPTEQYTINPTSYYQEDQTSSYFDGFITSCLYASDLDVHDSKIDENIHLFPNPCSTSIKVQLKQKSTGKWDVRLLDIYGRICFKSTFFENEFLISVENLPSGIYIIDCVQQGINIKSIIIKI